MTDQPDERKAAVEQANNWLGSLGLADLSLYWPTNKPIPQIDYESGEAQPTLLQLLADFALLREGELRKRVQELEQADIKRVQDISRFVIERDEALAENERLRVELKNIAEHDLGCECDDHSEEACCNHADEFCPTCIADAALNPAPGGKQDAE